MALWYQPFLDTGEGRKLISGTEEDLDAILGLPADALRELLSLHIRNLFRVDGLCPPGDRDGEVWCRWKFTQKT